MNFDNIQAAAEKSFTYPGTIGIFTMEKIEFAKSTQKQTDYMKVTFADNASSFNHSFFMKGKDEDTTRKLLSRIQSLAKAALGHELTGNVDEAGLIQLFTGKQLALKVTGQVSDQGKGYPNLSFGGFCRPVSELNFLEFTEREKGEIENAKAAINRSAKSNADAELETAAASTGSGARKF